MAGPNQGTIGMAIPRHASDGYRRICAGSIVRIPSILDRQVASVLLILRFASEGRCAQVRTSQSGH